MAGRRPKPTEMKKLDGNPGKRPLNKDEPQPRVKQPTCPAHLVGQARTEWYRMVKLLIELKLLTEVDRAALAGYCQSWARWVEAEQEIRSGGMTIVTEKGNVIQSPYVGIANQAMKQMRAFLIEFGMTPSSRARVKVSSADEGDPYEHYRRNKGG